MTTRPGTYEEVVEAYQALHRVAMRERHWLPSPYKSQKGQPDE